ncbi:hypothetical protein RHMOL_Rhmol11G0033000 [Rhododendron molle]|uniref:Uncharacterized protein n=1 Tax=Rhododendron molle TaxID=49168 RepID=A0ACC0LNM4_RHOML|nr:hypothetical protein RHMOL_Rhmol11G0033000 [Rhododendron molle]
MFLPATRALGKVVATRRRVPWHVAIKTTREILGLLASVTRENTTHCPGDASLLREKLVAYVASAGRWFFVGYGTVPSLIFLDDALVFPYGNDSLLRGKHVVLGVVRRLFDLRWLYGTDPWKSSSMMHWC